MVSFSSFLDETTQYADIVLPNHTYLERWGDSQNFTNGGVPVLGLQQPVVTPFYDTRHTGDVLLEIGQNLGESFRKIFPDISFKKLLMDKFKKVFESSKGNVFGVKYEAAWTQLLERSGWKAYSHTSFDDFWQSVIQRGGWWDPIYYYGEWNRVFKTDSRKFEFAPLILGRTLSSQGTKDTELQNLPHFEPLPSQSSEV